FISGSGDKRGHGKTPLFMAGMKCLPLCKVPLLSAANNCVQPIDMNGTIQEFPIKRVFVDTLLFCSDCSGKDPDGCTLCYQLMADIERYENIRNVL
ncbi:MAG: hypothetical protein Q7V05_11740, partial [Methanoregula sp.]|nr:hypothetical protein [Methanoregula sp.]